MSKYHDDSAELAKRLENNMEAVLDKYWSGWIVQRVKSQDVALLTPRMKVSAKTGKKSKMTSSFTLNLSGDRRGQWYRFSQGIGGGMLSFLYYSKNGGMPSSKSDWAEAYKLAREFLGIAQEREETEDEKSAREEKRGKDQVERKERERAAAEKKAKAEARRILTAHDVLNEAIPLKSSQGEAYLVDRGIPPIEEWPWDCSLTLRFHPSLDFEPDRSVGRFAAIVAAVLDPFGNLTSVWQVFLAHGLPKKADLEPSPKIGRGPLNGGAIRIGGDAPRVGGGEGLETSLGIWALEGYRMPIWSFTSTSGMIGFEPPIFLKRLSIFHDGDRGQIQNGRILKPPGQNAADILAKRMSEVDVGTNMNEMPILGDGLDLLQTRNEIERSK